MDPKNIRLYGGNGLYFIEEQYQKDNNFDCKDTIFDCEDTIFDYDDDLIIVPLQLKIKNFYYQIRNYGSGDNIICIEKTD